MDIWVCRSWCVCLVLGRQHYYLLYVIKPGFASPLLYCVLEWIHPKKYEIYSEYNIYSVHFSKSQTHHCFHVDSTWTSRTSSKGGYSKGAGILFLLSYLLTSLLASSSSNIVTDLIRYGTLLPSQRHTKTPLSVNFSM